MRRDWTHGGAIDRMQAQFPDAPSPWIDLSTGINPWPYRDPDHDQAVFNRLPTRAAYDACRDAMAAAIGAPPESLCLAPGSELLIRTLPRLLSPSRVAVLSPTYGDHAEVWRAAKCEVLEREDPLACAEEVDMIVLCNPNNPDGQTFAPDALRTALAILAQKRGWLIVDEAYADLRPNLSLAAAGGTDGLIILRSFGKFYGLAGLRLGAMIAPPRLCEQMTDQLGAWPVSSGALEIGARAYRDIGWQSRTRATLTEMRILLDQVLTTHGIEIVGGTDLFRLVRPGDAPALWQRLAEAGIYVRRFDALPGHLRIGLPANEIQLARLNEALSLSG